MQSYSIQINVLILHLLIDKKYSIYIDVRLALRLYVTFLEEKYFKLFSIKIMRRYDVSNFSYQWTMSYNSTYKICKRKISADFHFYFSVFVLCNTYCNIA